MLLFTNNVIHNLENNIIRHRNGKNVQNKLELAQKIFLIYDAYSSLIKISFLKDTVIDFFPTQTIMKLTKSSQGKMHSIHNLQSKQNFKKLFKTNVQLL